MAVVVGIKDAHYGEVVGAFLGKENGRPTPPDNEMRDWVRRKLGKHKSPTHIFWLGQKGVSQSVPLTGSGKVRKFEMAQLGSKLVQDKIAAKL
jgi:long-chain acyl-CoA synthetase